MYICNCNAINDRTVREIIASGSARTPSAIHRAAGCKTQCGHCLPELAEMISEHHTANALAQAAD